MVSREQAGEQADHPATNDCDPPPPNAVAEDPHVAAELLHGGVQQPVRADGPMWAT